MKAESKLFLTDLKYADRRSPMFRIYILPSSSVRRRRQCVIAKRW